MCGIVGIAGFEDPSLLEKMSESIFHRGPDDHGEFSRDGLSFAMRRLSIIDVAGGHQPLFSPDNQVVIVFNGEIYNYPELREKLKNDGHPFKTQSDTEVVLAGYLHYGPSLFEKLNGMFAVAIGDFRKSPQLILARDRYGMKPLYYALKNGKLVFGSETKAVRLWENVSSDSDPMAIDSYLRIRFVAGPHTLFKDIQQLPPGHFATYEKGQWTEESYVSFPKVEAPLELSEEEALEKLDFYLNQAAKRMLLSDVPVGSYLSGGVDSSLITALLAKHSSKPIHTFSVGFHHSTDETSLAQETAKALGTEHHEIFCEASHFDLLDKILYHLDEPIGDAIIVPMYLVAKLARENVKVVTSGEGADEIFAGYLFHKVIHHAVKMKSFSPKGVRQLGMNLYDRIPHQWLNSVFSYPAALGNEGKKKVRKFLSLNEAANPIELYYFLISLVDADDLYGCYTPAFRSSLRSLELPPAQGNDNLSVLLNAQWKDWLPSLMLNKLDKLSMANSLEGRFLYLDNDLVDFVQKLPSSMKLRGLKDKYLLRRVADRYLKQPTARRKKTPFFIPVEFMKGIEPKFDRLKFLTKLPFDPEETEFLHRRKAISFWLLNRYLEIHDLEARF